MASVTLDWLHIVVLLGAIQGVLLSVVLATQRRNRLANRLLAVVMFAFSLHLISVVYHAAGLENVFPHFFGVAYPLPMLYGPLIYLYAVTAGDRARQLRRWDLLHFLPFAVVVVASLPVYLMSGAEKLAFNQQLMEGYRPTMVQWVDTLKFVSGISYAVATIAFLRQHRNRIRESYSFLDRVNLQWLLRLAGGGAVIWGIAAFLHFTEPFNYALLERQDDIVALAIAMLVYGTGYMALRQPEIFNVVTSEYRISEQGTPGGRTVPASAERTAVPNAAPRYERSGLSPVEADALKDDLLAAMDTEGIYRNSTLTLPDLAEQLRTTPHKLSEVLNTQLAVSFYDFVNGYRVRDVQQRMADRRFRNQTLLALALDAGFASKSTFNDVFKRYTGSTPSAYRASLDLSGSAADGSRDAAK